MSNQRRDPKIEALKRRGTLHPHPERVTDELLLSQSFFDPRDLVQIKYEMLRKVLIDTLPVSVAARTCGFSRPTFYEALKAFERAGLPGLLPAKRGPRRAHKLSGEIMEFVEGEFRRDPSIGWGELVNLILDRFAVRVHRRSVQRAIQRRQGGDST